MRGAIEGARTTVRTDGLATYRSLADVGFRSVGPKHLPRYLDEFAYRFGHRDRDAVVRRRGWHHRGGHAARVRGLPPPREARAKVVVREGVPALHETAESP
jgi:hypothetical protein